MADPCSVILDEPFTAIDVNGVDRDPSVWRSIRSRGDLILTTHQPLNVIESKVAAFH
ncbi:hypothetical protein ACLB1T_32985 [Escherichia coli]